MTASWSTAWRAVFARDATARRRLEQGRLWLQAGRVSGLRSAPGIVSGRVQGDEATPYVVDIELSEWGDPTWDRVTELLGSRARHHADLLAGIVPESLADDLADAGLALLPGPGEAEIRCRCGDRAELCLHAAAVWEAAAAAIDADPFGLLRVRGRGRQQLLAALAAHRRPDATDRLPLGELTSEGWSSLGADLDRLPLGPDPRSATPDALLRLLGDPPGWEGRVDAAALLGPLVERAAAQAAAEGDPRAEDGPAPPSEQRGV